MSNPMASYTVGFILSLVFTLIPYQLVANQIITGRLLLLTILGFAVLQMIVQVVFFLHLGRGPEPRWNLYFLLGTIVAILVVVGGSIVIINNLHGNKVSSSDQTKRLVDSEGIYQVGGEKTGACKGRYANHKVSFKNGKIEPLVTLASRCDTLTFIEDGGQEVEIKFGQHEEHSVYAGLVEITLRKDRQKTITLSESGTYQFHDNMRPEALGTFAVYDN